MITKIVNMIKRAIVSNVAKDSGNVQIGQAQAMGQVVDYEPIYPYGYSANAPKNSLLILFALRGDSGDLVGIPYDPFNRNKNLEEGEVVIGNLITGANIKFAADGSIVLTPAAGKQVKIAGDFGVTGAASFSTNITSNGKNIGDLHTHSGVTTGGGNSGPVV